MKINTKKIAIITATTVVALGGILLLKSPTDAAFVSVEACVQEWESNTMHSFSESTISFVNESGQAISVGGVPLEVHLEQSAAPAGSPSFEGVSYDPVTQNLVGEAYFPYMESIISFGGSLGLNTATIDTLSIPSNQLIWGNLTDTILLSPLDITPNGTGGYSIEGNGVHLMASGGFNVGFGYLEFHGLSINQNDNISEPCREEITLVAGNATTSTWFTNYAGECSYKVNLGWASDNVVNCVAESGPWPDSMIGEDIGDAGVVETKTINSTNEVVLSCEGGYSGVTLLEKVRLECNETLDCSESPDNETSFCICQSDPTSDLCLDSLGDFKYIES